MDKRTLPSRSAKNKAKELFQNMTKGSDEDSDYSVQKGHKAQSDDSLSEDERSNHGENETDSQSCDSDHLPAPPRSRARKAQLSRKRKTRSTRKKIVEITIDEPEEITIKEEPISEGESDDDLENDITQPTIDMENCPSTFTIVKQALNPLDSNTAIWTTSAFTITAVLPQGDDNDSSSNINETNPAKVTEGQKTGCVPCPLCNLSFTKMKLRKHINNEHPGVDRPFICDICNKGWKSWDRMNDHKISHTDTTMHKCDLCDKSFKRKYTLQAHVFYKHSSSEGFKNSLYQTKRTVQRKRPEPIGRKVGSYTIEENALPPFKCPEPNCDEIHDTICRLQRHFAQAHKVREFVCDTCGKCYAGKHDLNIHQRCHRDERPYICEQCGSTYKSKAHLNCHILRTHDEAGHEQYKAYRRVAVKKLKLTKLKMKEKEVANSAGTNNIVDNSTATSTKMEILDEHDPTSGGETSDADPLLMDQ